MNLPLVSVIIPIYNQEKYLKKCVTSILNQTYENLEILLVNDGSSDHSMKICQYYAKQDSRCYIIDKENGGLSSARNAGMKVAKGEYITFVDSDDYLEIDAIKQMVHEAMDHSLDIVCMNVYSVNCDYTEKYEINPIKREFLGRKLDGRDYLKGVCKREFSESVWAKLFGKEIIRKYKFAIGKLNEDFLFLSEVLMKQKAKVGFIEYYGYCYYVRKGSISRSGFGKSSIDALYNARAMQQLAMVEAPELEKYYGAYTLYQARTALILMVDGGVEKYKDIEKECIELMKKNVRYIRTSFMSAKDKIFCFGMAYIPRITMETLQKVRKR